MSGFSPAFERLGAALAAVVLQQQETLAEFLPREDWSADLTARTYTSGGVTVRVSLLGSYAARERTWLWGWANPQFGDAHPAVTPTLVIRTIGERLGITEFTTPEVDLSWYEGPAGHGGELIAMAAGGVLGGGGYIGAGLRRRLRLPARRRPAGAPRPVGPRPPPPPAHERDRPVPPRAAPHPRRPALPPPRPLPPDRPPHRGRPPRRRHRPGPLRRPRPLRRLEGCAYCGFLVFGPWGPKN
ncbi:DUF6882 domain-containing protein [Actinomadura madurae]|uniref:DUF6882 domain-containing protein n=1 Tax=Actinomadura madurae TaxID=1993 RepID=UPI0035583782